MDRGIRDGKYKEVRVFTKDLYEKTLGIIGLGRIGKQTALRAKGFSMRIIYHDLLDYEEFASEHGLTKVPMEELLEKSDFISLHLPSDESTYFMIDKFEIEKMKPTAVLINTARASIVNNRGLYEAMHNGHLFGYGGEVFEEEPPSFRKLLELDNVVSTAHMAGVSEQAIQNMAMETANKVVAYLVNNRIPKNVLNPEVLGNLRVV